MKQKLHLILPSLKLHVLILIDLLHLLDAQQVTNQHLYHQIQLNNITEQTQVDALKELTASNLQRIFDFILQAYLFLKRTSRISLNGWRG